MIIHCNLIMRVLSVGDFKIISINNFTSSNNNIFEVFYRSYSERKVNFSAEIRKPLRKIFVSYKYVAFIRFSFFQFVLR